MEVLTCFILCSSRLMQLMLTKSLIRVMVFRKLSLELLQTQMYDKWRRKLDNVSANNEFERRIFTITSAVISKN